MHSQKTYRGWLGRSMPAGCNCGPNSPLARALAATACAAVLQSLPVSCHFRDCKAPLFRIVRSALSSELALPFFTSLSGLLLLSTQTLKCSLILFTSTDCLRPHFLHKAPFCITIRFTKMFRHCIFWPAALPSLLPSIYLSIYLSILSVCLCVFTALLCILRALLPESK